jgi:hypothetical protein
LACCSSSAVAALQGNLLSSFREESKARLQVLLQNLQLERIIKKLHANNNNNIFISQIKDSNLLLPILSDSFCCLAGQPAVQLQGGEQGAAAGAAAAGARHS